MDAGHYAGACECFRQSIESLPLPATWANLSQVFLDLGEIASGLHAARHGLALLWMPVPFTTGSRAFTCTCTQLNCQLPPGISIKLKATRAPPRPRLRVPAKDLYVLPA